MGSGSGRPLLENDRYCDRVLDGNPGQVWGDFLLQINALRVEQLFYAKALDHDLLAPIPPSSPSRLFWGPAQILLQKRLASPRYDDLLGYNDSSSVKLLRHFQLAVFRLCFTKEGAAN